MLLIHHPAVVTCCRGVCSVRRREDVRAIQGRIGAHIQVVGFRCVQYIIQCTRQGTADRSGWKTLVLVGVVR